MLSISSPRGFRIPLVILCAFLLIFAGLLYNHSSPLVEKLHFPELSLPFAKKPSRPHHIIDELVEQAHTEFDELRRRRTYGVERAAAAYRKRRGRHPPPEFDKWVQYAESQDAIVIEELFDQIYNDLEPFWALPAADIRKAALSWPHVVSVRDHVATFRSDKDRVWMGLWHSMIQQLEHLLPDVDLAINEMDESRLLVPWEKINEYMTIAAKTKRWAPPTPAAPVITVYGTLNTSTLMDDRPSVDDHWITSGNYWNIAREACPPDSAARTAELDSDFSTPAVFPSGYPYGTDATQGYVKNWTSAKDPCLHPHLRNLHGTFIEPLSLSTSTDLFPLFGGSKLPMNNEILLPAAMYWTDDEFYSGGDVHFDWKEKREGIIWRGSATGGRHRESNWRRFQRHRFVSMTNASQLVAEQTAHIAAEEAKVAHAADVSALAADASALAPHNFPLESLTLYNLSTSAFALASATTMDAAFVHMVCFPSLPDNAPWCPYTDPFYAIAPAMPMREQYRYKYLPDLDGNSFSGRYRGFLRSNSLPIKATVYSEFHDSRLLPWHHFVPMDNTYVDFFGLVDYFLGAPDAPPLEPVGMDGRRHRASAREKRTSVQNSAAAAAVVNRGHDDVAHAIARQGAEWAAQTLRKQDMLVYVYRLLLEYARVSGEERERMGWVGDF